MIKNLPYIPLILSFLLTACHKDEPTKPQILDLSINYDTLFHNNRTILNEHFSPVNSLTLTMNVSEIGSYSYYVNGTPVIMHSLDEVFQTTVPINTLWENPFSINETNKITVDLYSDAGEFYSSKETSLTLIPQRSVIPITAVNLNPSTVVISDNSVVTADNHPVEEIHLSLVLNSTEPVALMVLDTTVHLMNGRNTISLPLSKILHDVTNLANRKIPLALKHQSGNIGYTDTLTLEILSQLPDPLDRFSWHNHFLPHEFHNDFTIHNDAHISLAEAWKSSRGAGITIAIIDQGFEETHEDLIDNIVATFDAETGSSTLSSGGNRNHGTTCAGFAAAPLNNIGLSGVAPDAKLLLIASASLSDASLITAFEKAKQEGARVISCSWGSYNVSQVLSDKIQELYNEGIVTIFACGNNNMNLDENIHDESELHTVIGVSASNEQNLLCSYSNFGSNIDLMAPGGSYPGVLGLDLMGASGSFSQYHDSINNNYSFTMGTSFSAPIVAGVAALVLSVNPSLTPQQVRLILIESCDKIGNNAHYNAEGFDLKHAYGKINAYKAVKLAQTYR